jgi:hypothetical protein
MLGCLAMAYPKSKDPVKTKGISLPETIMAAADQRALEDDKNFSQYVRGLIIRDLTEKGILVRDDGGKYRINKDQRRKS